jgi:tripartite-type tricarboxylate transporter receptor subunit TctC
MFGPAGLSPKVVAELNSAARKAVDTPDFRKLLEAEAATAVSSTPEELGEFVRKDIARYAEIVKFTGATVD